MYYSVPTLICFEGDVEFSPEQQAKVNAIAAEGKRSLRGQLAKAEQQLSQLSESQSLTEAEREQLREALEETRSQLRTKEENAALEKKKLEAQHKREVADHKKRAEEAESKYRDSTIRSALVDAAAANGAYSNNILISVLQGDTSISEDGKVIVSLKVKDDDGKDTVLQMSPNDAVKWMKDRPEGGASYD